MENLIDREHEIQNLSDLVNSQSSTNKIIVLSGISGIGKSGIIEKFKMSKLISNDVITVKMNKSSVETIENLQYFNNIYKELEDFSIKNSSLVPTPTEYGIRNFGNLLRYVFYLLRSVLGLGDAEPLAEIGEESSIIRKKDYIIYLLNHSNIILNIDNIQNIDTQSFELLQFIIKNTKNKTFIFEYTLGEKEKTHFYNFYKELIDTGMTVKNFVVEKMDFSIAKSLAPKIIHLILM
ncbi:AAA family ATPase [Ruminococcus bovis]|nr:AAA family ATPase [Ruminococcus bovis]